MCWCVSMSLYVCECAHCRTTPFWRAHRQKIFSPMVLSDYKKRGVKRVFITAPHAHRSSRPPPTVTPCPTNLHWLANVSPAKRGAHSRKAVSSRFAFRVALSGHPIADQRTLLPVIPGGHLSLLWLPTLGSCGSLLACVARSLLLYRGFRFRVLLLLRNLLLLPLLGLRVATTTNSIHIYPVHFRVGVAHQWITPTKGNRTGHTQWQSTHALRQHSRRECQCQGFTSPRTRATGVF